MKREYDGTVARIAGNLLSGDVKAWFHQGDEQRSRAVVASVATARAIVAETKRTDPTSDVALSEVITQPTDRAGLVIEGKP